MNLSAFPGCCSASILKNFNEGKHAQTDGYYNFRNVDLKRAKNEIKAFVNRAKDQGDGLVVIITNDTQTYINKVLLAMKVEHSPWCKKKQHPDTRIRVWYIRTDKKYG